MIIIQTAQKDTFVTDMTTQFNSGANANFGQASTLDLFKIVGENKSIKSRSLLTIIEPFEGDTFTLEDSLGNTKTFEFDLDDDGVQVNNIALTSSLTDDVVTEINLQQDLNISAYKLEENKILLKQEKTGTSGDTVPVISNERSVTITPFRRISHSAVLLTYDLKSIYDNHISDLQNSIFTNDEGNASDFKAYIKLTDVGVSDTSPKNFKVRIRALNNDFNEGLGKDVVHFSDLGDANFKTINSLTDTQWTNEGIVSSGDIYNSSSFSQEIVIEKGNEDIVFDITDHVYDFLLSAVNSNILTQTFVIDFSHENLFDEYTYFVKRFASRNISNKYKRPKLEIKIKDEKFENVSYDTKKRFLDNEETFYLTNMVNKNVIDFPAGTSQKLQLTYEDTTISSISLEMLRIPDDNSYITIVDSNGLSLNYGFKFNGGNIQDVDNSRVLDTSTGIDSDGDGVNDFKTIQQILLDLKSLVEGVNGHNGEIIVTNNQNTLTFKQSNPSLAQVRFLEKSNDTSTSIILKNKEDIFNIFSDVIAPSSVYDYKGNELPGIKKFTIDSTTLSRFNESKKFQADLNLNKKVAIDLKYYLIKNNKDFLVKSDSVDFLLPETSELDMFKKLRVVLDTQQKEIDADDSIKLLSFSFIDIARQYKSVNIPRELVSEDLGKIHYTMYNVDSGKEIISNDSSFDDTLLVFNGSHYVANLFASSMYKNIRVGFKFDYTDPLTGLIKKISDNKLIVRFK